MKNIEKLNAIIAENFAYLAEIEELNKNNSTWDDKDLEAVMEKFGITVEETASIMRAMQNARYIARTRAVKAADKAAQEDVTAGVIIGAGESLYSIVWCAVHDTVMTTLYKRLAKVQA